MAKFKVYAEVSFNIEAENADEAMLKAGTIMGNMEWEPEYEGFGNVTWNKAQLEENHGRESD